MDINLDYYKIFYCVAKRRSFTKAAQELFIAQPNVTRTVKALESKLGCALLLRTKRAVELTPEGEKLFSHLEIAMRHIRTGENELLACKNLQGGTVSVGAGEIALYGLLLPVLKSFGETHRGIKLKIGNYTTRQSIAALNDGFADLAVVTTPIENENGLNITPLKSFCEVAACAPVYCKNLPPEVGISDFAALPMVGLGRATVTYDFYRDKLLPLGLKYEPDIEVATADQILPVIKSGLGVGFVPEFFLKNSGDDVITVPLTDFNVTRTICLATRADRPLNLAAQRLQEEIIKSCA